MEWIIIGMIMVYVGAMLNIVKILFYLFLILILAIGIVFVVLIIKSIINYYVSKKKNE